MWLLHLIKKQRQSGLLNFDLDPRSALALLLAVVILVVGALSVSESLHQTLHANGGAHDGLCLVCLLVKGQISVAETTTVFLLLAGCLLAGQRVLTLFLQPAPECRCFPPRAPPGR